MHIDKISIVSRLNQLTNSHDRGHIKSGRKKHRNGVYPFVSSIREKEKSVKGCLWTERLHRGKKENLNRGDYEIT